MSLSWRQRKTRLSALLTSHGDENADGTAVDRLMHGQTVIGKTSKTTEIDALRFQDKDLDVAGTLEYGQFGIIEVVTCRIDNRVYVRKSIEKKFALRTREQCSPQAERNILLQASLTNSPWVPHLLAAYQMPTHLNIVMDYAEGGTLWDVLESSPYEGKILESDLRWWAPQVVSAIHWCHDQGYAHRDIKPHNFVLTKDAHILLIDFGSAAPLLPPGPDGTQRLPRKYCLVPCGTCDYISPEILKAHEEALVALEMDDDNDNTMAKEAKEETEGYGVETDWWSLGAMLYEMAYGMAPFFANEIRHTYQRIMNHEKGLRFSPEDTISPELRDLLQRFLTHAEKRLGRRNVMEITDHPFFEGVAWTSLASEPAPSTIHLPQFTYSEPKADNAPAPNSDSQYNESFSQGFAFSALFQSSQATSPGVSVSRPSNTPNFRASIREDPNSSFIGFSWGPTIDAFPDQAPDSAQPDHQFSHATPTPLRTLSVHPTPGFSFPSHPNHITPGYGNTLSTPLPNRFSYATPVRPYSHSPMHTLQRTSTLHRTAPRRSVSDREAMKQLVDCVGMSARKKVLESGRKPRILTSFSLNRRRSGGPGTVPSNTKTSSGTNYGALRKELRFESTVTPIPMPNYNSYNYSDPSIPKSRLAPLVLDRGDSMDSGDEGGGDRYYAYSASEGTDSEGPPSPSPSPRPGSAMSMVSRRSGTPTITMSMTTSNFSQRLRSASSSSATGFLSIPSPLLGSGLPPSARFAPSSGGLISGSKLSRPQQRQPLIADPVRPQQQPKRQELQPSIDQYVSELWDKLEERHQQMMMDIDHLEQRLEQVSQTVVRLRR